MNVTILQDGVYLNMNLKAVNKKAGETLETGEAYAKSLIDDGYASASMPSTATQSKPKRRRKRPAK